MATKHPSGFKVPVRPAPAPPPSRPQAVQFNSNRAMAPPSKPAPNLMENWDFSFDDSFSKPNGSTFHSPWPDKPAGKKIPPPRPPPPKITTAQCKNMSKQASKQSKQGSKQATSRPSELFTNLFTRLGPKGDGVPQSSSGRPAVPCLPPVPVAVTTAPLIDLNSPPSSPTPTTRSSSDGLSVDSFGSDGTTSHSHHHSQVESGFEDDSDLFGGATATPSPIMKDPWGPTSHVSGDPFSSTNTLASASTPKNPWASVPQDPFSPPRKNNPTPSPTPTAPTVSVSVPGVVAFKPTIIRPKVKPNSSPSISRSKPPVQPLPVQFDAGVDDRSESPPMPSIPPPAPPAEILEEFEHKSNIMEDGNGIHGPHCVALYKFEGSDPDDLSFEENDVIELVKEVNSDWLRGRLNGREGMFPANFVRVSVPLNDTGGIYATALYPFAAETWEDLELQEGARVLLLSRIDPDWLYGEYDGKRGQFPASFVDKVPGNLPMRKS